MKERLNCDEQSNIDERRFAVVSCWDYRIAIGVYILIIVVCIVLIILASFDEL